MRRSRSGSSKRRKFKMEREKVHERTSGGGGIPYIKQGFEIFKPKPERNRIRVLPPTWDNPDHYGVTLKVHNNVGTNSRSYLCLQGMKGEDCPICEEVELANKEGNDDYAKKIGVKSRVLMWLIDRSDEDNNPKLWSMPNQWPADMDNKFLTLAVDQDDGGVLQYHDLDEGYDLLFTYYPPKGKTPGQFSTFEIARRSSVVDDDEVVEITEENPLPDLLVYKSYDALKELFDGQTEEDSDEDTDETADSGDARQERAARKKVTRTKKSNKTKEDDELTLEGLTMNDLDELSKDALVDIADKLGFDEVEDMRSSQLRDEIASALGFADEDQEESKDAGRKDKRKRQVNNSSQDDDSRDDDKDEEDSDDNEDGEGSVSVRDKMRDRLKSLRKRRK